MMEALGNYVLTLTAASIAAGILISLCAGTPHQPLIRLLCGVFLTLTALNPVRSYSLPDIRQWSFSFSADSGQAVLQGENQAQKAMEAIITEEVEAYILDKAKEWNPDLTITVHLSEGIPQAVDLHGQLPPEGKEALMRILTEDLGIAKENQRWIGGN